MNPPCLVHCCSAPISPNMAKSRKAKPTASSAKASTTAKPVTKPAISQTTSSLPSRAPSPALDEDVDDEPPIPILPFRFFDLPSELRLRIYEEVFHVTERHVMELYEGKMRANNIVGLDQRPDPPLDLGRFISTYNIVSRPSTDWQTRTQRELVPYQTPIKPPQSQSPYARRSISRLLQPADAPVSSSRSVLLYQEAFAGAHTS